MSKEQVDEIVDDLLNNRLELTSFVYESLEQAERVQELEEIIEVEGSAFNSLENMYINLEQQNKRYREAIENIKRRIHLKHETALELSVGIADEIENLYKDLEESE